MKQWKYSVSSADAAPLAAPLLLLGTPEENLKTAARLGYDAIEIHTREDAQLDVNGIRSLSKELGVGISAIVTGRLNTEGHCDLIADEPYITKACVDGMKQYIDLAAALGTDIILGWARGKVPAGADRRRYMDRLAGNLKILDSYAGDRNVRILIEVINRYEINTFNTAEEIMSFLETHALPNCYAHLDTFHMGIDEENPLEAIRRCGMRLGYFHLADSTRKYPGSGQLDFTKLLETLEEVGYEGYLSVECLPYPDHIRAAEEALQFMKQTERSK
ncbi:MAG: sugar phosphate isomerase/epimerase [Firmicutes bacterium]|nr:sugar phosphate isomerase/epimerase [Bacillota bacterium]